jgi:hypothetical protein
MQSSKKAKYGPRRFQWSAGGWFGSAFGSSAWMLFSAGSLCIHDQYLIALFSATAFAIVCAAASILWHLRDRIFPFTALISLLGILAVVIPAVLLIVSLNASTESLAAMHWPASVWPSALALAIIPAMIVWFIYLELSTPQSSANRDAQTPSKIA